MPEFGREKESIVEPKLLYITNRDPEVEQDVLPFFCFPTGVNVRVSGAAKMQPSSSSSGTSNRENETFNFLSPENDQSNTPLSYPSAIGNNRCFAFFLLSSHSSAQQALNPTMQTHKFGVCLLVQRSFRDHARGVVVTCDYCVCVVSKLPFFSFLFHLLIQFEAVGGLELSVPVRAHNSSDDNDGPYELRMLRELSKRLHNVRVPLFPSATNGPTSAVNVNGGEREGEGEGKVDENAKESPEINTSGLSYPSLKFTMTVSVGTPRVSIANAIGLSIAISSTPTPSPNMSRSRSPSLVATAMTAAQLNQPASRLLPNYVACTGQLGCLFDVSLNASFLFFHISNLYFAHFISSFLLSCVIILYGPTTQWMHSQRRVLSNLPPVV